MEKFRATHIAKGHPQTGEADKCLQKGHNMGILAQDRKGKEIRKESKVNKKSLLSHKARTDG